MERTNTNFAYGTRGKRMHIQVRKEAGDIICAESKKRGVKIGDFIVQSALDFEMCDFRREVGLIMSKIDAYAKKNRINFEDTGVNKMENKNMEKMNMNERQQFHLRVPKETYDEIAAKAAQLCMSVSDYVTFVTTCFDVKEISKKLDEINHKLDIISEQNK